MENGNDQNNEENEERQLEFGYWLIKFKAEHIRYLLYYLGEDLKSVGGFKEWNPKNPKDWANKKNRLSGYNPLVSIPYLKSKETVVSRPGAILMAICMKADRTDLLGATLEESVQVRALQSIAEDLRIFAYDALKRKKEQIVEAYEKYWKNKIQHIVLNLSNQLGNQKFFLGTVTVADFELAHMIELYGWLFNIVGIYDPFIQKPNLMGLVKTVKQLPGVSTYVTSPQAKSTKWLLPKSAVFMKE